MIAMMLLGGFNWKDIIAYSAPSDFNVTEVKVFKEYDRNRNMQKRTIAIRGAGLEDVDVAIETTGGYVPLENPDMQDYALVQFEIEEEQVGRVILVEGIPIQINEDEMPTITSVNRSVVEDDPDDSLVIKGTDLENIGKTIDSFKVSAEYRYKESKGSSFTYDDNTSTEENTIALKNPTGKLGLQNIIFSQEGDIETQKFPGDEDTTSTQSKVKVSVQHAYIHQFRLVKTLPNMEDLKMFPNRGEPGDEIKFTGQKLDEYDVFFLKSTDGTDPYTKENKGKNTIYKQDAGDEIGEDVLTVDVPNIDVGEYYVVLTNKISPNSDPYEEVNQVYIVKIDNSNTDPMAEKEKFYVIDGTLKPKIKDVEDDYGYDSGGKTVTVLGQFLGSLPSESELNLDNKTPTGINGFGTENLSITYGEGTYKVYDVKKVERELSISIGNIVTFTENPDSGITVGDKVYGITLNKDLDKIDVIIPQVNDAEEYPDKKVMATIITKIYIKDTSGETETIKTITMMEEADWGDERFHYIPSQVEPNITNVVPNRIQLTEDGEVGKDIKIGIYGSNFMIHKYKNGDGEQITRYPKVQIGDFVLDKNTDNNVDIRIFDNSGKELDGTKDNELGSKILVTIPRDYGPALEEDEEKYPVDVRIVNPIRNSDEEGYGDTLDNGIEFVKIEAGQEPSIDIIKETNVSVLEGGDEYVIEGERFKEGVSLILDGEIIDGKRESDTRITFTAPPGRKGEKQLIVINKDGGFDTASFEYIETYTDPEITDFNPKNGNTGTLVVLKGKNLVKPDPNAIKENIKDRLIGTRILLEKEDINDYSDNFYDDNIPLKDKLENYRHSDEVDDILRIENNKVELADYYHSIVLYDEDRDEYFTIDIDNANRIFLKGDSDREFIIKTALEEEDLKIIAEGQNYEGDYTLDVKSDGTSDYIQMTDSEGNESKLRVKTIYKIENGKIVGNRVKVLSENKLYFTVPILPRGTDMLTPDGNYYDVTIKNPDTKKDSKEDEEGFKYAPTTETDPDIIDTDPVQGSIEGGFELTINGTGFTTDKYSPPTVILDGEIIDKEYIDPVSSTEIRVLKVPPYKKPNEDDYSLDRIVVPLVVVNDDGASAKKEDGFIYVKPSSEPHINEITWEDNNAAGGSIVTIDGRGFKFSEPIYNEGTDREYHIDVNGDGEINTREDIKKAKEDIPNLSEDEIKENLLDPVKIEREDGYNYYYESPILPIVKFDNKEAKIVDFDADRGLIHVILPPREEGAGPVEVYVINNDSGISNKETFNYEVKDLSITDIIPGSADIEGEGRVSIEGTNFAPSDMKIINENGAEINKRMMKVNFGRGSHALDPENQGFDGDRSNGLEKVVLANALETLTATYDVNDNKLKLEVKVKKDKDPPTYDIGDGISYDGEEIFLDLRMLKDEKGESYGGYELVRIMEVDDNKLVVERGYAPEVEVESSTLLDVTTPSYYLPGNPITVTVINPDGVEAEHGFVYDDPQVKPVITNIMKNGIDPIDDEEENKRILKVDHSATSNIKIVGYNFKNVLNVYIVGLGELGKISKEEFSQPATETEIYFKMPEIPKEIVENDPDAEYVLIVENGRADGTPGNGTARSDEAVPTKILIKLTMGGSQPIINKVTPSKGEADGGTEVTIEGEGFIEYMEGKEERLSVSFGDVEASDFQVVDNERIIVKTPPNQPDEVEVIVTNPDGDESNPGAFTYLSNPKITAIVDPNDEYETSRIEEISAEGNQLIKLKGSGFLEGARVVFIPKITSISTEEDAERQAIYIDGEIYDLLDGKDGTEVEVIDSETIVVKTPQGKQDEIGIMVINPDSGASEIYEGLKYGLPKLATPQEVKAELVYDRYIKVNWQEVTGAQQYEIYVVIDDNEKEYVGNTKLTSFVYEDLEPDTEYMFIVTALGDYGSSKYSRESNEVETGRKVGPPDDDGGLEENNKLEKVGDTAKVTIGTKDYDEKEISIDLTRGALAGSKEVIISMPAEVIGSSDAKDITVYGSDFRVKFNPNVFYSSLIRENRKDNDAGVRFTIAQPTTENQENTGTKAQSLSSKYDLRAHIFIGKGKENITDLRAPIQLTLDVDIAKARMRRMKALSLSKYDVYDKKWIPIAIGDKDSMSIMGLTESLGQFTIIGNRR